MRINIILFVLEAKRSTDGTEEMRYVNAFILEISFFTISDFPGWLGFFFSIHLLNVIAARTLVGETHGMQQGYIIQKHRHQPHTHTQTHTFRIDSYKIVQTISLWFFQCAVSITDE